ncbi:hypothetical protein [Hydrogenophaga sp.]|jgi:altronate hydrolase|uniref:hypothetical protein n=1 Tax=Hydrogenophaga sp. TaxID=1904254 RepID=UPI003F6EA7C6
MKPGSSSGADPPPVFLLHPEDNVLVARTELPAGAVVTRKPIPAGHKLARRDLQHGEPIVKCLATIGFTASDIPAGTLLSGTNIEFREFERPHDIGTEYRPIDLVPETARRTFL